MNKCDHVPSMDETPDEGHAHSLHPGNSQATSGDHSEAEDHLVERNGERQHLSEKQGKNKSRAGVLSRLRKKLSLRSGQSSGPYASSAVRPTHMDGVEVGRDGPIIVNKERTPRYRCVPNPPGCIPTEVMLKAEDENEACSSEPPHCSGLVDTSTVIDGANHIQKACQHGNRNKNSVIASNVQIYEGSRPIKVLYNNWIDPQL